ncbi:MAG TPA: hypothetical protein VFE32_11325 [Puia sp.]|nr:hypothetical protein [Puia sp.]
MFLILIVSFKPGFAQIPTFRAPLQLQDTAVKPADTLRIRNLNPYFSLHVDSNLNYQLEINRDPNRYFFFMKDAPVGMKIRENGLLTFRAERSYFLSGRLKYDIPYKVKIGVQNLDNPKERLDTSFTIQFFTTDVIPSRVKPTVSSLLTIDEGDTINFRVQCETGTYPIESINFYSNVPIRGNTIVEKCDDLFTWSPPYDFVKETDSGKSKLLILYFVGTNKMFQRDTATVKIYVKDALNYPYAKDDYNQTLTNMRVYMLRLKYAFFQLDKKVKHTKNTRQDFDITAAATGLGGTIATASNNMTTGEILPSVGVAMVPVKETAAPPLTAEQNQATLVRAAVKRLDYMIHDNTLVGEKDPDITKKTAALKAELKQTQIQLIDVPLEETVNMTEEQLNAYFDNPRVNKKYRMKH